jgi:hypothetical protein
VQPRSASHCESLALSMPSAVVRTPRLFPRARTASMILPLSVHSPSDWTKERSILIRLNLMSRRCARLE